MNCAAAEDVAASYRTRPSAANYFNQIDLNQAGSHLGADSHGLGRKRLISLLLGIFEAKI